MEHLGELQFLLHGCSPDSVSASHLHITTSVVFGYLDSIFGAHRVLGLKTNLTMPPRRVSQYLHLDEGLPQTSDQNQPLFQQSSTQTLPTTTEATENPTFDDILEI
jgi:hypothetical protein